MSRSITQSPVGRLLASHRAVVIGHRGYCEFAPENTLPSFELAMSAGADLVELDCHQSKDGVLVVIHDPELGRTTDARRRWKKRHSRVDETNVREIQDLDAGSWFDGKFAGVNVPTLAEALDLIRKSSIALIERKSGNAAALIKLLREKRLINKVIVQSFDWAFLRSIHEMAPAQTLAALGPPKVLSTGRKPAAIFRRLNKTWLSEIEKTGARIAVWNQKVSRKAIELAHQQGVKVWIYTINNEKQARRLLTMGVDGMITNNPSVVWKAIALRKGKG